MNFTGPHSRLNVKEHPKYNIFFRFCKRVLSNMPSGKASEAIGVIICLLPSISLQGCGLFSPYWIKNDATSDCYRGVVYNVDCPDNVEGKKNQSSLEICLIIDFFFKCFICMFFILTYYRTRKYSSCASGNLLHYHSPCNRFILNHVALLR